MNDFILHTQNTHSHGMASPGNIRDWNIPEEIFFEGALELEY